MNLKSEKDFVETLQTLKPKAVSVSVQKRLEKTIRLREKERERAKWAERFRWGSYIVAASVVLAFGIGIFSGQFGSPERDQIKTKFAKNETSSSTSSQTDRVTDNNKYVPVIAENELRNRIDEGIVFLKNGMPARRYRYEFMDRVVWKNKADGSVMEMEVPREEIVLVPVQTF